MDKLVYIAAVAAKNAMDRQANVSNNVANVNTPGFRGQILAHRTSPVISEDGKATRAYSMETVTGYDATAGLLQQTDRKLDLGLQNRGWFSVQNQQGQEVYTRGGHFSVTPNGDLVNANGDLVLGDGGTINLPEGVEFTIADNGIISGFLPGNNGQAQIVELGRLKLVDPPKESMVRGEDGYFRTQGGPAEADEGVRIVSGFLETSNVNPVEAMVQMISAGREFEANMKLISMEEENSKASNSLLSLN